MANKTSPEKTETTKERTASPEKESKMETDQPGTTGAKPLAAKSGYYYAHNQVIAALCRIFASYIFPYWFHRNYLLW